MPDQLSIVQLHRTAPAKPVLGDPCNGCGVCCAVEPCPVGQLLSGRRTGRCVALTWDDSASRYLCGAVTVEAGSWWQRMRRALVLRWIAAGVGCDSTLQAFESGGATMPRSEPVHPDDSTTLPP